MKDRVFSIAKGKVIKVTEVNDTMFSQKMMGDGAAIYPTYKKGLFAKDEDIYAPCDGEVIMVFNEKHALGFRTECGNEILVHMGIDTVELKGKPFTITCNVGDKVKAGQKIGSVNWKSIEKAGKDTVTPIIVTNAKGKEIKIIKDSGEIDINTVLFEIETL